MFPDQLAARMVRPHRTTALRRCALLLAVTALLPVGAAFARTSDRQQAMDIEAGRQSGTFSGDSVNVLTGGVHITQGSLDITSSTARVTLADGEPTRAVFSGGPVVLKQLMDDGTPLSARANGVDYNLKTEVVVFTGAVTIQQPRGTMSGERVVYNLKTGNVESGGEGAGRVKMRILPRNQGAAAPAGTAPAGTAPASTTPDNGDDN